MQTLDILTHRLPEAIKLIEKLMKKANKYGNTPISYSVKDSFMVTRTQVIKTEDGPQEREVNVSMTTIEVSGEAPTVEGYEFYGRVEFLPHEGGALLQSLKDKEIPEVFRHNNDGHCDHCKMERRRKDVYILRHEGIGHFVQVGRTCLRDFLGVDVPAYVLSRFELIKALDERLGEFGGFGQGYTQSLKEYLHIASFAIRNFGWCPAAAQYDYGKVCTRDMVEMLMDYKNPLYKQYELAMQEQAEKSEDEMKAVTNWVRNELEPVGNYQHNLKAIFAEDLFYEPKHRGLICSAIHAYHRAMDKIQAQAVTEPSSFIGELGKRVKDLEAIIKDFRSLGMSEFGEKFLVKFLVNGKDVAVWFTTSQIDWTLGETVKIAGTVKDYSEYQGVKQTTLSRVRVA